MCGISPRCRKYAPLVERVEIIRAKSRHWTSIMEIKTSVRERLSPRPINYNRKTTKNATILSRRNFSTRANKIIIIIPRRVFRSYVLFYSTHTHTRNRGHLNRIDFVNTTRDNLNIISDFLPVHIRVRFIIRKIRKKKKIVSVETTTITIVKSLHGEIARNSGVRRCFD